MKPQGKKNELQTSKDSKKSTKKQVTVKFKVNIWTAVFGILLILFFLPPLFSMLGIGGTDLKIDVSQALMDLKNDKEALVKIEDVILED